MPGKSKIRPSELRTGSGSIQTSPPPIARTISFNFSRLNEGPNGEFKYTDRGSSYFTSLMERFKNLSSLSRDELLQRSGRRDTFRVHPINWDDARCSIKTFGLPAVVGQDVDDDAFQISLSLSNGRVHGYFVTNTFHVVWLDPRHNLYPGLGNIDFDEFSPETEQVTHSDDLNDCRKKLAKASREYDQISKEFIEHLDTCPQGSNSATLSK